MGRESFRFVHVAGLHLDEPVVGIGSLTGSDRQLAEDATLLAWDRVVEACIQNAVDFLLITGDSFEASAQSLRARVALEKGFEKLAVHQVQVYVAAGKIDPVSTWKRWVHLPPNVTLLEADRSEPVLIHRGKEVLAAVYVVAGAEADEINWSAAGPAALGHRKSAFLLGIVAAGAPVEWRDQRPVAPEKPGVPQAAARLVQAAIDGGVDYLALANNMRETFPVRSGLAHSSGFTQSLSAEETGTSSCSLVHVPSQGLPRIEFIPTGPVRFEKLALRFGDRTNWDELTSRMAQAVRELPQDTAARLWMLTWQLRGTARLFDQLTSDRAQTELWELLEAELGEADGYRRLHRLVLEHWTDREQFSDPLLEEMELVVAEEGLFLVEELRREAARLERLPERYRHQLAEIVRDTPRKTLISNARALVLEQLQGDVG